MKKSKYGNKKCEYLGLKFDSKGERERYIFLLAAEKDGKIQGLGCQIPFVFEVNGKRICRYVSDFTYILDGKIIVEDFKSKHTRKNPVYRLKKKLMKAIHDIDIREVLSPTEEI